MPDGSFSQLALGSLSIVLIDLVLAGDNALVIAMAVRALPDHQRKIATMSGTLAAVLLRILLTIVATRLLGLEFLKILGGLLVIWIAVKVLADAGAPQVKETSHGSLMKAIWLVVVADITMSIDNVLAIAGAAKGSTGLIIFGLGLSIPLIVFASNLIAKMMDRYAVIIYLGSAILADVGADMVLKDPFTIRTLHPTEVISYVARGVTVVAALAIGRYICVREAREK